MHTSSGGALKVVRRGHAVKNSDGEVTEHISPYWVALKRYDAFTGNPCDVPAAEVSYYANPFDRLSRTHVGENEIMTGLGFPPAWPTRHW